MRWNRKLTLTIISILLLSLFIVGCGSKKPRTLEEYISQGQGDNDMLQSIVADDENATLSVTENTLEITYTVSDVNYTADILNNALSSLGDTFSDIIIDVESKTGIDDVKIKVTYVDTNGKEITSKVFE